jgi:hypothetical protein
LSNVVWIRRDFGPEELHHLGVAFENCCAAMPETKSQEFRERLAYACLTGLPLVPPMRRIFTRGLCMIIAHYNDCTRQALGDKKGVKNRNP